MGRLDGKRAVVTGAASGIGRAAAELFAAEGAVVIAADIDSAVDETVARITAAGGTALAQPCDVSDEAAVAALVARSVADHGGLDVMFANAGIVGAMESIWDLQVDDWRRVFDVNVLGVFLCLKHAALHMRDAGAGSIVCTASVAGLRSGAGPAPYSATKAAVINLVQTAAWQLSGTGVRANAICPGLIETGMTEPVFTAARAKGAEHKIGQLNPTRRAGQAPEIAAAALFLASDESSYVNGHALIADGGFHASHPVMPGRQW